ncbi:hypothetical protein [Microseira sp. BLCC-F43]|uniref:hypothetical protein n=1 Tax=Microseira sp. BLCC-F43 TaxID=3153602 RepID=UPI0035B76D69
MTQIGSEITFEQAIAATKSLLEQVEANQLSPEQIGEAIAALVQSENGARGFFVTYLVSSSSLASHPSEELVQALRSSPDIVAELLAKNVAMSAAMALTHRRNDDEPMAQSSEQVRDRSAALIKLVDQDAVYDRCRKLLESAVTGAGRYQAFLDRWGYDAEQRQLICEALESAIVVPQTNDRLSSDEEEATETIEVISNSVASE